MGFHIPAESSFVRILNKHSGKVLCDKDGLDHQDKDSVTPEQWWHIKPQDEGRYIIVNDVSKRVLWCRNKDRRAGCVDGGGKWSDNWFVFEEGKLQYSGWFRLRCQATNSVLVSRTEKNPQLDGFHLDDDGVNPIYEDQYFQFLDEEAESVEVTYDLPDKPDRGEPMAVDEQSLPNDSDEKQSQSFTLTQTKTSEHSHEFSEGIEIAYGTEFSTSIPVPVSIGTKVTWNYKSTTTYKYGTKSTDTDTWTLLQPVIVPARSVVTATTSIHKSTINVPYTMSWKSKYSKTVQKMEGVYKGVQFWGFETKFVQSKLEDYENEGGAEVEDGVIAAPGQTRTVAWPLPWQAAKDKKEDRSLDEDRASEPVTFESGDGSAELQEGEHVTDYEDRDTEEPKYDETAEAEGNAEEVEEPSESGYPDAQEEFRDEETAGDEGDTGEMEQPEQDGYEGPVDEEATERPETDWTAETEYAEADEVNTAEGEEAAEAENVEEEPGQPEQEAYAEPEYVEEEDQLVPDETSTEEPRPYSDENDDFENSETDGGRIGEGSRREYGEEEGEGDIADTAEYGEAEDTNRYNRYE